MNPTNVTSVLSITVATGSIIWLRNCLFPHGTLIQTFVMPLMSKFLTSESCQHLFWKCAKLQRNVFNSNTKHQLIAFISADDPQSFVLVQCLKILMKLPHGTECTIKFVIIRPGTVAWDQGNMGPQLKWGLNDCKGFAKLYDLDAPSMTDEMINNHSLEKLKERFSAITNLLLNLSLQQNSSSSDCCDGILNVLKFIWTSSHAHDGNNIDSELSLQELRLDLNAQRKLDANNALLSSLGFYGSGVVEYMGEFYSPSRLHHLERRLLNVRSGLKAGGRATYDSRVHFNRELDQLFAQSVSVPAAAAAQLSGYNLPAAVASPASRCPLQVHLYYSFRSPYSQLALPRLRAICNHYGARLTVKAMMPMVMRGMPVPFQKVKFISLDCAREARLWDLPFGCCCDPIVPDGKPVMRALSVFTLAQRLGLEEQFVASFAEHVWSKGVHAGTDRGLRCITDKAGISWGAVTAALADSQVEEQWRDMTVKNRARLYDAGLWGVPCMEVLVDEEKCSSQDRVVNLDNNLIVWGQDKIWMIESALRRACE